MNTYSTKNIRNVVLLGSSKSGKTTLAEALMYEGKVIDRRGTVEGKNTISDNTEVEQINQRSIYATPLYAEFMGDYDYCHSGLVAKVEEEFMDLDLGL